MIHLSIPRKGLFSETADVAARLGISTRKQVALTAKFIKMGGGELSDVSLSTSTAWREKHSKTLIRPKEIMEDLKKNMPDFVEVHWDGKIIEYENQETDDRLCIKVRHLWEFLT